jgi:hypothetical protein
MPFVKLYYPRALIQVYQPLESLFANMRFMHRSFFDASPLYLYRNPGSVTGSAIGAYKPGQICKFVDDNAISFV